MDSLQQFSIITTAGSSWGEQLAVAITAPSGARVQPRIIPFTQDGQLTGGYLVEYVPMELGDYMITVSYGGRVLPCYRIRSVEPPSSAAGRVRAFGSGLSGGFSGRQADFVIDTRSAGPGGLGVTVEGPSEAMIRCRDNGDGTCCVAYIPTAKGEYQINITFKDEPIPGSPFLANFILDPIYQIRTTGHGIQPDKGRIARQPSCIRIHIPSRHTKHIRMHRHQKKKKERFFFLFFFVILFVWVWIVPYPHFLRFPSRMSSSERKAYTSIVLCFFFTLILYFLPLISDRVFFFLYPFFCMGVVNIDCVGPPSFFLFLKFLLCISRSISSIYIGVFVDSPTEFTVDSRAVPGNKGAKVTSLITTPSGKRLEPAITPQPDGQARVGYTPFEEGNLLQTETLLEVNNF